MKKLQHIAILNAIAVLTGCGGEATSYPQPATPPAASPALQATVIAQPNDASVPATPTRHGEGHEHDRQ